MLPKSLLYLTSKPLTSAGPSTHRSRVHSPWLLLRTRTAARLGASLCSLSPKTSWPFRDCWLVKTRKPSNLTLTSTSSSLTLVREGRSASGVPLSSTTNVSFWPLNHASKSLPCSRASTETSWWRKCLRSDKIAAIPPTIYRRSWIETRRTI